MKYLVLATLNIIDAFLTLYLVEIGATREANPLMALALLYHPLVFIGAKIVLSLLITSCMFSAETRLMYYLVWLALASYTLVMGMHAVSFLIYLGVL
jgi:hypothetical protein